jgi:hypothetical protein
MTIVHGLVVGEAGVEGDRKGGKDEDEVESTMHRERRREIATKA